MIIQLTSKSSQSGIAQEIFWDIGIVINHSELKLLLAQAAIFFTFSIVLHCFIKLWNGLSSWSTSIKVQILFALKARFFKLDRGMHCIDQGLNK